MKNVLKSSKEKKSDDDISYAPLWNSLKKKGLHKNNLKDYGFSESMINTYLSKNKFVDSHIIYDLCDKLNLKPSQVYRFHFNKMKSNESYVKKMKEKKNAEI